MIFVTVLYFIIVQKIHQKCPECLLVSDTSEKENINCLTLFLTSFGFYVSALHVF